MHPDATYIHNQTVSTMINQFTIDLEDAGIEDINLVGGKNASLGEMIKHLTPLGIYIPGGFAITVNGYHEFMRYNNLDDQVHEMIDGIDMKNLISLRKGGTQVRQLIRNGKFPPLLEDEIRSCYTSLSQRYNQEATDVAIRSSATAEDLPDKSFAGQQETYLNVRGQEGVLDAVRNCFASLFTDRAISYRVDFNVDHFAVGISVGVQKMVRSDLASSVVAFSLDTESGFRNVVVINGSFGLGEMVVKGAVTPDEFMVFKTTLERSYQPIIEKRLGKKDRKLVYSDDPGQHTKELTVAKELQDHFCLSDRQVLKLAEWVCLIEKYYSGKKGAWCPVDVEWALDGLTNKLFIVQARPETIHSNKPHRNHIHVEYTLKEDGNKRLVSGVAVGDSVAVGKAAILYSLDGRDGSRDGASFQKGDILVTEMTDPDWEPIMKKASAIITNKGGRTCHAAIVARELGIPALVGCENATDALFDGQLVTASCCEGRTGSVYNGEVPFEKKETDLRTLPRISTQIMLNIGSPDLAFQFSALPNEGVGLAREEFIISTYVQVHPLALLEHHKLNDPQLSDKIKELIKGFENEQAFFISMLSYGIAKIASAFYPNKVIVRFSDFKTNEYANLLGGNYFEPKEENPMIGWRGASRYYSNEYKKAFGLECKAIKRVREVMGLTNVIVMIPFCRTVDELLKVYAIMDAYGLRRGANGLQIYLMAEIPSNILLADEFAKYVDGFSIGTNDLTQLTLGLDRDSAIVAGIYDERNAAVKKIISMLIVAAKKARVKVGICGQAPSDFPDFTSFLVDEGIESISVTPDAVLKTILAIHESELQSMSDKRPWALQVQH
jgi:pyruvate, water dikinase